MKFKCRNKVDQQGLILFNRDFFESRSDAQLKIIYATVIIYANLIINLVAAPNPSSDHHVAQTLMTAVISGITIHTDVIV